MLHTLSYKGHFLSTIYYTAIPQRHTYTESYLVGQVILVNLFFLDKVFHSFDFVGTSFV